jgi:signal transduction histidine kinase
LAGKYHMLTTIRSKLLTILLLFILVTLIASALVFTYYQRSKDALSKITHQAETTHALLLKDMQVTRDFFEHETINPNFFETGRSELITRHHAMCDKIDQSLADLDQAQKKSDFGLGSTISSLKGDFSTYKLLTDVILKQILIRGFKDYGIEGSMRRYAHYLENYSYEIGLVKILQLRRHEKDFIIRLEDPYIIKHNDLVKSIKDSLAANQKINPVRKEEMLKTLVNYSKEFNNLVSYEKRLGLKSQEGLKKRTDDIFNKLELYLSAAVELSAQKEAQALSNIRLVYISIGLVFILISLIAALAISRKVSSSLIHLNESINEFVKSEFTIRTVLPANNSVNEIDVLTTNFSIMEQHIVNQMRSLKESNRNLEMLFYVTSHDIRNPLIQVKNLTDHALQKITEPEAREYLLRIDESWGRLITITDELGIVTNVKNAEIKTETIHLDKLIRSVYSEFGHLGGFDNIIFSLDLRTDSTFISSPGLVRSIFRNLVENSIKYSTKRKGLSFLKISIVDQNEEMLKIEVADNGIGIKKEHQDKIFDMFFRGTSQASGTGLGLYIVMCSVKKLYGAIGVESDENTGTTFTILLPNNHSEKNLKESILHELEMPVLLSASLK